MPWCGWPRSSVSPVPPPSPVPVTHNPLVLPPPAQSTCCPGSPVIPCTAWKACPSSAVCELLYSAMAHPLDLQCGSPGTGKARIPVILCGPMLTGPWWRPPDIMMCPQQRTGSSHPLPFLHASVHRVGGMPHGGDGGTTETVSCHRVVLVSVK